MWGRLAAVAARRAEVAAAYDGDVPPDDPVLIALADVFPDRLEGAFNQLSKIKHHADRIDVPQERRFVGFDAYQKALDEAVRRKIRFRLQVDYRDVV